MKTAKVLVAMLPLLVLPYGSNAQKSQDAAPTFTATSEVILVPVVVRDKTGKHITGLGKGDFSVNENGKPQTVAFFQEVQSQTVIKPVKVNAGELSNQLSADTGPQKVTIIAIDAVNATVTDQAYARLQLLKFLNTRLNKGEPTTLLVLRDNGIRVIHDFTTDTAALIAALKGVTGTVSVNTNTPKTGNSAFSQEMVRAAITEGMSNQNLSATDPFVKLLADDVEALLAFQYGEEGEYYRTRAAELTLEGLQHIAQAYAGIPGRKSLLWITGGLPFDVDKNGTLRSPAQFFKGVTNAMNYGGTASTNGALPPLPDATNLIRDDQLKVLEPLYQQTLRALSAANMAVYPIDARGLVVYFPGADSQGINLTLSHEQELLHAESRNSLDRFAQMTGGKICFNHNDLAECFRDADTDTDRYYLLGYYRDQKIKKAGWRTIEVRLQRPDAVVRARDGYFYSPEGPDSKSARQMDVSLALASPLDYTAVPFTAKWRKVGATGADGKNPLRFDLYLPPGAAFIDEQHGNALNLDFVALASTPKGERADQVAQTITANLKPEAMTQIRTDGINYNNTLKLAPGHYTVRFIVRDNSSGRMGSIVTAVTVN
ncbi:MAG TPA: VWA domain-containing protein [Terriglobales bacterium]|nr:VWA domain-containing protein [Terriglobales bacterium]